MVSIVIRTDHGTQEGNYHFTENRDQIEISQQCMDSLLVRNEIGNKEI